MTAHSPGPWFVHPLFQTDVMGPGGMVARTEPTNEHRFHDARLIAAAPELLALLKAVLDPSSVGNTRQTVLHAAADLIRRIEGKS